MAERVPGRFALHDLLRAYATEVAYSYDSETYRLAAQGRMLDHYLYAACRANALINPLSGRPFALPGSGPEVTQESLADQKEALAWFESEHAVLLAVLRQTTEFDTQIWQLAWALASYFEYQGHWRDWRESQTIALDAARRLPDQLAQAHSHRLLSSVAIHLSAYEQARAHLRSALDLFGQLGDAIGQADVHHNLAWMLERQGRHREALPHVQQALTLSQAAGHHAGQARALNALGWFHAQLGEYEQALGCCGRLSTCSTRSAIFSARPPPMTASAMSIAISATSSRPPPAMKKPSGCTATWVTCTTRLTPWPHSVTPTWPSVIWNPPAEPGSAHWQFSSSLAIPTWVRCVPEYMKTQIDLTELFSA